MEWLIVAFIETVAIVTAAALASVTFLELIQTLDFI